ncbi:MAG TPA: hypothetical protein VL501_00170 [Pyrinomonadaceae bacterium]|nr:hypothetical protein [Pyrinomonadaceae bacterium]
MKRLEEKVKDIVDVRAFAPLTDLTADPALTLSGYRFTDITSDLMAKWLERVSGLNRGVGLACALAGFRGVGKTHFLTAVAAILARPDLRAQIDDAHVRSAAEGLPRRAYHVAMVRRGSEDSLLDELKTGLAAATGLERQALGGSVSEMLHHCSVQYADLPFVIFFDTMTGREARVARDDGAVLSEVAEVGKSMGMFIGVALDDDISGADGANSSIAGSFLIDYLDQEHLFKIVDTHIFAKNGSKLPLLREIYEEWRSELPAFRWSEQRFLSLYPMHPATLEVAPLIRLYLQDFALLGFASEAGIKILGRPANSLIGLDEMFDSVEAKLRQVPELTDVFTSFDKIESDVIAKAPVTKRLTAKLVLKGLFLLSLDSQGVSPDDVSAGMMILGGGSANASVAEILSSFTAAGVVESDGLFSLGTRAAAAATPSALELATANADDGVIWDLLLRLASEKFSDLEPSDDLGRAPSICTVEWRGALRRGEIIWRGSERTSTTSDWTMVVERRETPRVDLHGEHPTLLWRVAPLTDQEKATLKRHHVLRSDPVVREELGAGLATALQIHSIASERIWQRVFLNDARLLAADGEYPIFDETVGAHTLSQLMSNALTPYFEALYPQHPQFGGSLGVRETSALISDFFGGGAPESAATKQLVDTFAAPLGLAVTFDSSVIPTPGEELRELPVVKDALGDTATTTEVSLDEVGQRLAAAPRGLTREAQHLVLAALVAQKQFDFVTASGNRINHRSLDLQIIWDDIEGIAPPQTEEYGVDRLLSWAKVLTGNQSLKSIDRGEDRAQIVDSLRQWLSDWNADNTLAKFDTLPEEQLNTAVWRLASGLKRTFGAAAGAIESLLKEEITLVECLRSIAVMFSDSEADYELKTDDLAVLNKYVIVSGRRGQMLTYVAATDWTGDEAIDSLRRELLGHLVGGGVALNGTNDRNDELWTKYRELYAAHYSQKHQEAADVAAGGEAARDLRGSEMWNAFVSVSELPLVDPRLRVEAEDLMSELRAGGCDANAGIVLSDRPVCVCGKGITDLQRASELPSRLTSLIERGLREFGSNVMQHRREIVERGRRMPGSNIEFVVDSFSDNKGFPRLTAAEIRSLSDACRHLRPAGSPGELSDITELDAEFALMSLGE